MFQYSFFERDLVALRTRYKHLSDQVRAARAQISQAARTERASQDGAAQRMSYDHDGVIASQLRNMEEWINNAVIIAPQPFDGLIRMGVVVMLKEVSTGEYAWYCISSFWSPEEGKGTQECPTNTSYATPFARALIGKRTGDVAVIKIGKGRDTSYAIVEVTPGPYQVPLAVVSEVPVSAEHPPAAAQPSAA
jgi:transcription elongation GreA/GreB family factor